MKQLLLALLLIAMPVGAFSAFQMYHTSSAQTHAASGLGDLSSFRKAVAQAREIAGKGDLAAAERKMTEFETAWDMAQPRLRKLNSGLWGSIDDAHDVALHALRAGKPDTADVQAALAWLAAVLDNPATGLVGTGGSIPSLVAGVPVTDANGRALPCEEMLATLRAESASAGLAVPEKAKIDDLLARGTERCNADDDKRADGFFAQGLALIRN